MFGNNKAAKVAAPDSTTAGEAMVVDEPKSKKRVKLPSVSFPDLEKPAFVLAGACIAAMAFLAVMLFKGVSSEQLADINKLLVGLVVLMVATMLVCAIGIFTQGEQT